MGFFWEVNNLELKDYFKPIYEVTVRDLYSPSRKNSGIFITKLFIAGGSHHFVLPQGIVKAEHVETQRKIYNGNFEFTPELKATFHKVDIDSLASFYRQAIPDGRVRDVMRNFGVPDDVDKNPDMFCKALAYQFEAFVQSTTQEASDIVLIKYQQLQEIGDKPSTAPARTKYPSDVPMISPNQKSVHQISSHDKDVIHEWIIQNRGKREWRGRRLYFANHADVRPRAVSNYVDIPDTKPGEYIKVATSMDARRHEGKTVCHWIMIDDQGDDCFPNSSTLVYRERCHDFVQGTTIDIVKSMDEAPDIHHIFPEAYCIKKGYKREKWNSIVNKTPLLPESNRQIGGEAPSAYSKRVMRKAEIDEAELRARVESHLVDYDLFITDDFDGYFIARAKAIMKAIEAAMGKLIADKGSEQTINIYGVTLEDQPKESSRQEVYRQQ